MRKQIRLFLAVTVFFWVLIQQTARADYFEHHIDGEKYCMQAKDIKITEMELEDWVRLGTLKERIIEKSELTVRRFRAEDMEEPWEVYEGSYEIDASGLYEMDSQLGQQIPIMIYLAQETQDDIFIEIGVTVTAETSGEPSSMESGENLPKTVEKNDKTIETKKKNVKIWRPKYVQAACLFFMASAGVAFGFGKSLHSDFKILSHYKRRLEKKGEKWTWRY